MLNIHETVAERTLGKISDAEMRVAIGRLFAEAQGLVDSGDVNLVILAVRRLTCLYQLLVREGMPPIAGCLVVSDRYLDANPQRDWSAARVLILDDSVVVGTTLVRLNDRLGEKAQRVICRSVCVDGEQSVGYLLSGLDFAALHERNSQAVQTFAREVVQALFEHQVPFFSDFPVTKAINIALAEWSGYLENAEWHLADVTAPLLGDPSHHALVQIPTQATIDRFLSRITPEASSLVDGIKIRLYIREVAAGRQVVFVPIAMLAPCRPSQLDRALDEVSTAIRQADAELELAWRDWSPSAKHRLLQLYLSACVLAEIWPAIESGANASPTGLQAGNLEHAQVGLYFGDSTEAVLRAFDAVVDTYRSTRAGQYAPAPQVRLDSPRRSPVLSEGDLQELLWDQRELLASTGLPEQPSKGELTKLGLIFAHAVASVFGFINRRYEMPERELIRSFKSRSEYHKHFGDGIQRLFNQGITMRELTIALAPDCATGSPWVRSIVSLGIDAGNDLGIIVPVTRYDELRNVVYRCYRLGETAQLAEWPLPSAMQDNDSDADDLTTQSVQNGFPFLGVTAPITSEWRAQRPKNSDRAMAALRATVTDALPGHISARFEGTVTRVVDDDYFEAELSSPSGDDERVAWMRLEQVPSTDQSRVEPGVDFTWSVFVRERRGARDRVSRVRLRSNTPLNSKLMYRSVKELGNLVSGSDAIPG